MASLTATAIDDYFDDDLTAEEEALLCEIDNQLLVASSSTAPLPLPTKGALPSERRTSTYSTAIVAERQVQSHVGAGAYMLGAVASDRGESSRTGAYASPDSTTDGVHYPDREFSQGRIPLLPHPGEHHITD